MEGDDAGAREEVAVAEAEEQGRRRVVMEQAGQGARGGGLAGGEGARWPDERGGGVWRKQGSGSGSGRRRGSCGEGKKRKERKKKD